MLATVPQSSAEHSQPAYILPPDRLIDEELTPGYDPKYYYPARIGDILHDQYRIITKVGFGCSSTVWLAEDIRR